MPYQSRYTATIADLMGAGQRARMEAAARAQQAEAEARNVGAQAWGNFAQNMGGMANNVAGVVLETQRQNKLDAIAARRDAETAKTHEMQRQLLQFQVTDRETAQQAKQREMEKDIFLDALLKDAMTTDPDTGLTTYDRGKLQAGFTKGGLMEHWEKYAGLVDKSDAAITGVHAARKAAVKSMIELVDAAGNNPVVFKSEIERGLRNKLFTIEDIQPIIQSSLSTGEPTQKDVAAFTAKYLGREQKFGTAGPNDTIYNQGTGAIAHEGAPKEKTLDEQILAAHTANNMKEYNRLLGIKGAMGKADDRPQQPIFIMTDAGKQVFDPTTQTTSPIKDASGNTIAAPKTAEMRNKEVARAEVGKSITPIKQLSLQIITKVGPAQRMDALKRGADVVFGNDPAFKTYQDARSALAGNLAVAQQGSRPSDSDIKSIWLPLVPDPYTDTAESAAMKWQLIETMSGQTLNAPPPPPNNAQAPPAPAGWKYVPKTGGGWTAVPADVQ